MHNRGKHTYLIKIISTAVVCLFAVNTIAWAYSSNPPTSTLAVQSSFKSMASLTKEGKKFVISEDEEALSYTEESFQRDAEQMYVNILCEQAREMGLSPEGLKKLVREYLSEHSFNNGNNFASLDQETLRIIVSLASIGHGGNRATEVVNAMAGLFAWVDVLRQDLRKAGFTENPILSELFDCIKSGSFVGVSYDYFFDIAIGEEEINVGSILEKKKEIIDFYKDFHGKREKYKENREEIWNSMDLSKNMLEQNFPGYKNFEAELDRLEGALSDRILLLEGKVSREIFDLRDIMGSLPEEMMMDTSKFLEMVVPETPVLVQGNRSSLAVLLGNMVTNAKKHGIEEKEDGRVVISLKKDNGEALIEVTDNGRGMGKYELYRLNEIFHTTNGTGIGTTEAGFIIRDHNGSIDVGSEPGKGTTFTIRLPLAEKQTIGHSEEVEDAPIVLSLNEGLWGRKFIDTVIIRANEAQSLFNEGKTESPQILVAIETGWIPDKQRPIMQGLLKKLSELSKEKGLNNITIERRKDPETLVSTINDLVSEKKIPTSNIVIIGQEQILESERFNVFRENISPEEWAFFVSINLPDTFSEDNYIQILEILTKALDLWSGKSVPFDASSLKIVREGMRAFRFIIPSASPVDYFVLKDIYEAQLKTITAA